MQRRGNTNTNTNTGGGGEGGGGVGGGGCDIPQECGAITWSSSNTNYGAVAHCALHYTHSYTNTQYTETNSLRSDTESG